MYEYAVIGLNTTQNNGKRGLMYDPSTWESCVMFLEDNIAFIRHGFTIARRVNGSSIWYTDWTETETKDLNFPGNKAV